MTQPVASMQPAIYSAFNGILSFGVGVIVCWAVGYLLGTTISRALGSSRKGHKSILADLLGFVGLFVGALILKDLFLK